MYAAGRRLLQRELDFTFARFVTALIENDAAAVSRERRALYYFHALLEAEETIRTVAERVDEEEGYGELKQLGPGTEAGSGAEN